MTTTPQGGGLIMFDVYATRDEQPTAKGETVTLQLVDSLEAPDGPAAIQAAVARANLAELTLGGLVAIEREAFTLREVSVQITDPNAPPVPNPGQE